MAEFASYQPGVPSWVDLSSSDPDTSKAFYTELFGWHVADLGPEAGGYAIFTKNDSQVAGVGPIMMPGQPPAWTTYVNVTDAEATASAVTAAGGTVIMGPMQVLDAGVMTICMGPDGGVIATWQAGEHKGAGLANEPGSFCWNELSSRNPDASATFYQEVFGWDGATADANGMPYTTFSIGGAPVAGMMPTPPTTPEAVPSHWLVYFAVEDADAAIATAERLGATLHFGPADVPQGRFAVLADPTGAVFAIIVLSPGA